jgi:hypothetical protein
MRSVPERVRAARARRRADHLREIRLSIPDARTEAVRMRVAEQVEALNRADEEDAVRWIEAVSLFDNDETR